MPDETHLPAPVSSAADITTFLLISKSLPPYVSTPHEYQATGSCNVFGRSVPSGWNTTFKGSTEGAADIAFVVDVAHCNRDKDLIKLLDGIDVEFEANGIVDARYALATSSQDNVGTITEFMKAAELAPDLRSLDMKGPPSKNGAAVAVIAAARNLKWRPGVSRTIIQLSCNPCDSAGVKRALRDNDITYHIISKGSISFGGSDAALSTNLRKKVFGYDEKFVYMAGDYQKLKGDADARGLLIDPEPSCMLTAQSTGGTVFSTFKWNPNKAKLEKKFLNVVAQRVAQSSVPPECQECRCGGRGTKAALMCRKCSTWLAEGGNVTQEEETLVEGMKRYFMNFYRGKIDPSDSSEPEKSTEKQPVPNGTTEASAPIFKDVTLPLPTAT
ncbi:hypothetical protein SK128_008231 [Halocaridina rubra]|uniref:Uncharacterized protein n=1 Tax=Halocaridina rubra TaxID=373956 RepID=A0AAN9ADY4_HALRR